MSQPTTFLNQQGARSLSRLKSIAEAALWVVAGLAGLMALFNLSMALISPWPH